MLLRSDVSICICTALTMSIDSSEICPNNEKVVQQRRMLNNRTIPYLKLKLWKQTCIFLFKQVRSVGVDDRNIVDID